MIYSVTGNVVAYDSSMVAVDVNGVAFRCITTLTTAQKCASVGAKVTLLTYMNVREDAMQLFGFLTRDDLKVFKLVIGVSGIGPKGGLSILSKLSPDELRFAVMANDAKAISAAPGIGKKTAEKLIIELKDKGYTLRRIQEDSRVVHTDGRKLSISTIQLIVKNRKDYE